ncbi:YaaL family protein [Fructilactobacillus sp. Tb1]|uniref:YaaL family protein n=1 Tax=Fructilactobacillus sp. Tb1 TaxID=3422304 RepID=UPI003D2B2AD8
MFGFKKKDFKKIYDEELLNSINLLKRDWDQAQQTQMAIADVDDQIIAQTELAKQKYEFMYRQARKRDIKNDHIQSNVYDH